MEDELYCVCRKPAGHNRFMINCSKCDKWFHGSCVSVKKSAKIPDIWLCPNCVKVTNEVKDCVSKVDFTQANNEIRILKEQMSNVMIIVKSLVNQNKMKEKSSNEKNWEVAALRADCIAKDKEIRMLQQQCDEKNKELVCLCEEKEVHEEHNRKLEQELKGVKEACEKELEAVKEACEKELEAVTESCKQKDVKISQLLVKIQLWKTKYEELENGRSDTKIV